jgi:hypothetical protein
LILAEGNTAHAQTCKYHSNQLNGGNAPVIPNEDEEIVERPIEGEDLFVDGDLIEAEDIVEDEVIDEDMET